MLLSIQNITKSFGAPPKSVLHGITFDIAPGELVALTGRSGSGKSTLLYILSTLDTPTSGIVRIGDSIVSQMSEHGIHKFRNQHMGFVFQFHYLLPELTALENILMPALKKGWEQKLRPRAKSLLEEFGLAEKFDSLPGQLSGGEQQRVAIARALIMEPQFLFADEPTGNLDSVSGDIVMKLLLKINREANTTIIYVTHDSAYASLARRRIHLVDGRIDTSGQ
jgi:ABC-type lipoprotein export system ATPase subunit